MKKVGIRLGLVLALAMILPSNVPAKMILLDSDPPGAFVYLDGSGLYRGIRLESGGNPLTTPASYDLSEGTRKLLFVKPGHATASIRLNVCAHPACPNATKVTLWPRNPEVYTLAENQVASGSAIPSNGFTGQAFMRIEDWNSDGRPDICLGNCSSETMHYMPTNDKRDTDFGPTTQVPIPLTGGVTLPCPRPFIVDWNNDSFIDTLFGLETGQLVIALATQIANTGFTPEYTLANPPQYGAFEGASTTPIQSGTQAIPWVLDADNDGRKDLLLGNFEGQLQLYPNIGTDSSPILGPPVPYGPDIRPQVCSGGTLNGQCCVFSDSDCVEGGGSCTTGSASVSDYVLADVNYDGELDLLVAYTSPNPCIDEPGVWVFLTDGPVGAPVFYPFPQKFRFLTGDNTYQTFADLAGACPPPWSLSLLDVADGDRNRARELFVGCGMGQMLQFRPVEVAGDADGDRVINGLDVIEASRLIGLTSASPDYRSGVDIPGWRNADGTTPLPPTLSGNPLPGEEFTLYNRDGSVDAEDRNRIVRAFGRTITLCGNNVIDGRCNDNNADCDTGPDKSGGTGDDSLALCAVPASAICLAGGRCNDNGAACNSGADHLYGTPDDDLAACADPPTASCVAGEECDDGNLKDNDGCSSFCLDEHLGTAQSQGCGNGLPDMFETCDDGMFNGQPCYCNITCTNYVPPVCGDGKLCAGEFCDDGETVINGHCNGTCTGPGNGQPSPVCGNGSIEIGETCDTGPLNGTTVCGCQSNCQMPAAGAACGGSATDCDALDTCDGEGNCMDNLDPSGSVCLVGTGICDPDDTCDGTTTDCLADLALVGTPCGGSAAACDALDTCDGEGTCVDRIDAVGALCALGTGFCDPDDFCDGLTKPCAPVHTPAGAECRADAGQCDVAEQCDGVGNCPPNGYEPDSTACDDGTPPAGDTCQGGSCQPASCATLCGNGVIDGGCPEACDDGAANGATTCGCQATCQHAPPATVCRASVGGCDLVENCDGAGACPSDGVRPSGFVCNTGSGDSCDPEETCDGLTGICPSDNVAPADTLCRAATDVCDQAETCSGNADEPCPSDALQPAGTECRADSDSGGCDVAEQCDGLADACPADACAGAGSSCSPPSGGLCDAACACTAVCDGTAASVDCTTAADCSSCSGGDCYQKVCLGYVPPSTNEFTICANGATGAGRCISSTCTGDDGTTQATSIGTDCARNDLSTGSLSFSSTFNVAAPGNFKIWLRVLFDVDWEGEIYNCDLDGGPTFTFNETGLDTGAYGVNCTANVAGNACWAGAFNNTAQPLTAGNHTVNCSINNVLGGTGPDTAGFDGLIVTNMSFVPSPGEGDGGVGGLCNADNVFTSGTCSGSNYGPIRTPSAEILGECDATSPEPFFTACGDPSTAPCDDPDFCDGAGTCLSNNKPAGSQCGTPQTECDPWDQCDAAGICQPVFSPPGEICGGAWGEPVCDPDGCDGAGTCSDNPFAPDGTPCGGVNTCQSGVCQ